MITRDPFRVQLEQDAARAKARKGSLAFCWIGLGILLGSGFVMVLTALPQDVRATIALMAAVGIGAFTILTGRAK